MIVMLLYISHVIENDEFMRETVKEQWHIHYFWNFKRVYLKLTFLRIRHLRKKGRYIVSLESYSETKLNLITFLSLPYLGNFYRKDN